MEKRVPYTPLQKAAEIFLAVLAVSMLVVLAVLWPSVPDTIPQHYNFQGEADAWGSKNILWVFPCIGFGAYLLMTIVGFLPTGCWNMPVTVTPRNYVFVYSTTRSMLLWVKLWLISMFYYLSVSTALSQNVGLWFSFAVFGVLAVIMTYYIVRIRRGAKRIQLMDEDD